MMITFDLLYQPIYQVAFFLVLTVLLAPLFGARNPNAVWNTSGLLYVGFMIMNAVYLFLGDGQWAYFFISLGCSLLYIALAGIAASSIIKVLRLDGSGESAMIFLSVIYHPFILLATMFLRWIVE